MDIFKKKEDQMLSTETASLMLYNIFEACGAEPSTIPLDELESYTNFRSDRYKLSRALLIVIMVLFMLIPLLFISPKIDSVKQTGEVHPVYKVEVSSFIPIKKVEATINGKNIPVYQQQSGIYSVEPDRLGTVVVTVTAKNRQYTSKIIRVTEVDNEPPSITNYELDGNKLIFYLEDSVSGVDLESVFTTDRNGNVYKPLSVDTKTNAVTFEYINDDITITIKDKAGNERRLLLTTD